MTHFNLQLQGCLNPSGMMVPFEEGLILRIAHVYQQMTDWHRREAKA
jgi:hypothetical protein